MEDYVYKYKIDDDKSRLQTDIEKTLKDVRRGFIMRLGLAIPITISDIYYSTLDGIQKELKYIEMFINIKDSKMTDKDFDVILYLTGGISDDMRYLDYLHKNSDFKNRVELEKFIRILYDMRRYITYDIGLL